jgi:hypothetical protein
MAKKNIVGPGGAFTTITGFNAKYESFSMTFDFGAVDNTGFEDNGWNYTDLSSCKVTANATGILQFDDSSAAPFPSAFIASTLAPASGAGSATFTFTTGCTMAGTFAVTNSVMNRSAKAGTRADITHTLENQGAVTMTWDETGA